MAHRLSTQIGPYAILPDWVLRQGLSSRAVHLYVVLTRHADDQGQSFPGRKLLADQLGCSVRSVDEAVKELTSAGALLVSPRHTGASAVPNRSNLWTIVQVCPGAESARGGAGNGTGGVQETAHITRPTELELLTSSASAPRTRKPDVLFEAVCNACAINWEQLTPTGRGPVNRAVKELRDLGATPNEVLGRAGELRRRYPTVTLTPTSLAKHWASLSYQAPVEQEGRELTDQERADWLALINEETADG